MKKESTQPISKLQKKLWNECRRIIRARYPNVCYTCGAMGLQGGNWQTGHLWAKASLGAFLKYDLRVLRPQCSDCNVWKGGQGADFYAKMLKEIGKKNMAILQKDRQVEVRAYDHYERLLAEYKTIQK